MILISLDEAREIANNIILEFWPNPTTALGGLRDAIMWAIYEENSPDAADYIVIEHYRSDWMNDPIATALRARIAAVLEKE